MVNLTRQDNVNFGPLVRYQPLLTLEIRHVTLKRNLWISCHLHPLLVGPVNETRGTICNYFSVEAMKNPHNEAQNIAITLLIQAKCS